MTDPKKLCCLPKTPCSPPDSYAVGDVLRFPSPSRLPGAGFPQRCRCAEPAAVPGAGRSAGATARPAAALHGTPPAPRGETPAEGTRCN